MDKAYRTDDILRDGRAYRVEYFEEEETYEPWKEEDGHGPVSEWTRRSKRPGERVLNQDRGLYRYYDIKSAIEIAKRDGWDAPPYGVGTPGQRAVRAVEANFKWLKAWCDGELYCLGVVVTEVREDQDGFEYDGPSASLWRIPSDSGEEYFAEIVNELVREVQAMIRPRVKQPTHKVSEESSDSE